MDDAASRDAIEDLKSMGIVYLRRGNRDKAAKVLHLAEAIEQRLNRFSSQCTEPEQWHIHHEESTEESEKGR